MTLQRRMNKKIYRAIWWVIVVLVVLSFMLSIVVPLWAAPAAPSGDLPPSLFSAVGALARWSTDPLLGTLLLAIGLAGLGRELFAMDWGLAGNLGALSLSAFFGGSYLAGVAGWATILLFLAGLALLLLEIRVFPGLCIPGLAGLSGLAAAVLLASSSIKAGLISLGGAALVAGLYLFIDLTIEPAGGGTE
ncbi:MAG: hypothetical protein QHH02_05325 [Syntrophomonadaceae bacterium]|nr:hypothetical protein [Syntrophomonadaceae bacterium]